MEALTIDQKNFEMISQYVPLTIIIKAIEDGEISFYISLLKLKQKK